MRIDAIVFDCEDAAPLARFWAAALGWRVAPYDSDELERLAAKGVADPEDDPSVMVEPPDDEPPGLPVLFFTEVPEPKAGKNRLHPDLTTKDLAAEVARLLALGATHLADHTEDGTTWATLADPEGNEFDVVAG